MELPKMSRVKDGKNFVKVQVGELALYFSFGEMVAYRIGTADVVVGAATHGRITTATHLDTIDGGSEQARATRLDPVAFERRWEWDLSAYLENGRSSAAPPCGQPSTPDPRMQPNPDPGNLCAWDGAVGRELCFRVTGRIIGLLWGTDVYTSDSELATVAVHAGLLQPGETGLVRVHMVAVLPSYRGTSRNGVVSRDWLIPWPGAYRVERC